MEKDWPEIVWLQPGDDGFGRQMASFCATFPNLNPMDIPIPPGVGNTEELDLNTLIAPIEVLRVFGSSKELKRKYGVLKEAATINRDTPGADNRRRLAVLLTKLGADMRQLAEVTHEAETLLREMGWTFDHSTGKVRRKGKGHRGKDFFSEIVWAFYATRYSDKGNTAFVRRKISRVLGEYFYEESDESARSSAAGAPIYLAIYNRERNSK